MFRVFYEGSQGYLFFELPYSLLQLVVHLVVAWRCLKTQNAATLCNRQIFFELEPEYAFEDLHVAVERYMDSDRHPLQPHIDSYLNLLLLRIVISTSALTPGIS